MCQAPGLRTLTLALNMVLQSQLLPEGLSDCPLGDRREPFSTQNTLLSQLGEGLSAIEGRNGTSVTNSLRVILPSGPPLSCHFGH